MREKLGEDRNPLRFVSVQPTFSALLRTSLSTMAPHASITVHLCLMLSPD
jgi:hypothetical protein